MPEGLTSSRLPFLDGIRAVAVLAVMGFHSDLPGVRTGGYLGVDCFFVLSGFLITGLLLDEVRSRGHIRLSRFWASRARRLLPPLAIVLLAVTAYVSFVAASGTYPGFRSDVFNVAGYVSNWHLIHSGSGYFAATAYPSLLTHTWTLAIEEQFYLIWPLLIVAVCAATRSSPRRGNWLVLALSVIGAAGSAGWMAYLYRSGASLNRLYYGTDTRAQALLLGAALAAAVGLSERTRRSTVPAVATGTLSSVGLSERTRRSTAPAVATGTLSAVGLGWMATHLTGSNSFAYQGGFLCFAALMVVLLWSLLHAGTQPVARFLSTRPLVYLGRISYGMYLWYFPLFEVLTAARTGLQGWDLFALRLASDILAASISFYLIERPIRSRFPLQADSPRRAALRPVAVSLSLLLLAVGFVEVEGGRTPTASVVARLSLPSRANGPTVRLLVLGDSTALTLELSMLESGVEPQFNVRFISGTILGCGLLVTTEVRSDAGVYPTPPPCNPGTPPSGLWPVLLRSDVEQLTPDVVLIATGYWEAADNKATQNGPWQNITEAADAREVQQELQLAIQIAGSRGASVVVATAPCFSAREQPSGLPLPEDSAARVAAFNQIAADAVSANRGASLLDLGAMVCPGGTFHRTIGGVTVRAPDGIHFPFFSPGNPAAADPDTRSQTVAFGEWISARMMPPVLSAGLAAIEKRDQHAGRIPS